MRNSRHQAGSLLTILLTWLLPLGCGNLQEDVDSSGQQLPNEQTREAVSALLASDAFGCDVQAYGFHECAGPYSVSPGHHIATYTTSWSCGSSVSYIAYNHDNGGKLGEVTNIRDGSRHNIWLNNTGRTIRVDLWADMSCILSGHVTGKAAWD